MISEEFEEVILLDELGKPDEALSLLERISSNVAVPQSTWMFLAITLQGVTTRLFCLRKTIELNPGNRQAVKLYYSLRDGNNHISKDSSTVNTNDTVGNREINQHRDKKINKHSLHKKSKKRRNSRIYNPTNRDQSTQDNEENGYVRKVIPIKFRDPTIIIVNPEDDFFGDKKGVNLISGENTGLYGNTLVVSGLHVSPLELPFCLKFSEPDNSIRCEDCDYFSPGECLLRYDDFLLNDLRSLAAYRLERRIEFARRSRNIAKIIHDELKAHGRPLHYSIIAKMIVHRYPKLHITEGNVYQFILWHPDMFERVDKGVYQSR